uniref:Centromere protein X n=1 Tax=Junco hyemalis TaxID=40217 RepID=A0A8C5IWX9_JUNHY
MAARAPPEPLPRNRSLAARAPARRAPGRRARPRAGHGRAGRPRWRLQEGTAVLGAAPSGGRGPGPAHPFLSPQDTVDRLLRLHFRDGRTRGTGAAAGGPGRAGPCRAPASRNRLVLAVNADAQLLMAELLKVFVREAAARAARQAQAEDLNKVDIEQLEKVLPQLLLDF